jgi:hypothetical protein
MTARLESSLHMMLAVRPELGQLCQQ